MPKEDIKDLFDDAREHLQKGVRRHEKTITDGVFEPPLASAPGAPKLAPPRPAQRVPKPAPELDSVPDNDAPVSSAAVFDDREAATKPAGRRRRAPLPLPEAPFPSYMPPAALTPSVMAKAAKLPLLKQLVIVITAATAVSGIITALGAAIVNIITALRPPSNYEIERRLDAMETRLSGDFGMTLETQTRQKKDEELGTKLDKLEKAQKAIQNHLPLEVKAKPPKDEN